MSQKRGVRLHDAADQLRQTYDQIWDRATVIATDAAGSHRHTMTSHDEPNPSATIA